MSMISRYIFGTPLPTMAVVREIAPSGGEIPHFTVTKADGSKSMDIFAEDTVVATGRRGADWLEKLCEKYDARNQDELAARGFFPEEIGMTENFRLTADSITFCYNPYDIGCYALGDIEVAIGLREIDMR